MYNQQFPCSTHPEEIITNYCCLRTCLTPLCPDCIDEHNKRHKAHNKFPEIDTIQRVKNMCSNKLSVVSQTLEDHLNRLNNATNINIEDILNESLQDLDKLKDKMIDQINKYFSQLKDEYVSKLRSSGAQINDFQELRKKIEQVVEELGAIKNGLEGPYLFDSIKNTTKLDSEHLLSTFEKMVEEALNKQVSLPTQFVFDEKYFSNFALELRKIISVDTKNIKVVTNDQYLSQLVPKKDGNKCVQYENYFNQKFKD